MALTHVTIEFERSSMLKGLLVTRVTVQPPGDNGSVHYIDLSDQLYELIQSSRPEKREGTTRLVQALLDEESARLIKKMEINQIGTL